MENPNPIKSTKNLTVFISIISLIVGGLITYAVTNHFYVKDQLKSEISLQKLNTDYESLKINYESLKTDNEELKQKVTDLASQSLTIEIFQKNWKEMQSMVNELTTTQVTDAETATSQVTDAETTQKIADYQKRVYIAPNGIPSDTYTTEIAKNQIGVLTCGPVRINDIFLPGGADPDRGSVVILLPENDKTTIYNFYELVPGHNWFGIYNVNEVNPNNVNILTNKHITEMRLPPNGTSGNGCTIIDVLILMGQNIYSGPETLYF